MKSDFKHLPLNIKDHTIIIRGLKVYYRTAGDPKYPPLILLNGWGAKVRGIFPNSEKVIKEFARHGFYVISPEHPGLMRSETPNSVWGPREYKEYLEEFIEKLGIQNFILVGQSFGGAIATAYAAEYPEKIKTLVLVDAGLTRDKAYFIVFRHFILAPHLSGILRSEYAPAFFKKIIVWLGLGVPWDYTEQESFGRRAVMGDIFRRWSLPNVYSKILTKATYAWRWCKVAERQHGHKLPKTAAEQIAGICAAVFQKDIALSANGFLEPNVAYAMDNCGMGGDLIVTANVSTIAALIAAAAGIPMCKHGSPANADQGRHGSSDFIALLGINTYADKSEVERCLEQERFAYTEALDVRYKRIHLQTHKVAMLPHMNDIIGPITNPLNPRLMTRRVVGVNHLISPRVVAKAYQILNARGVTNLQHGIFIRGFADKCRYEGMDEVSICEGGTQVAELLGTGIREYHLHSADFGLSPVPVSSISPDGISKGDFSLGILRGEITGPPLAMVLANAALLFYLAGRSQDLRECYVMAEVVQASDLAYEKVLRVRQRLPKVEGR